MTAEQWEKMQELVYSVQRLRLAAEGAYIPYELAAAIAKADDIQAEVNQFIYAVQPSEERT